MIIALLFIMLQLAPSQECVVLLHGLARSSESFSVMEKRLKQEGYHVINVDYESRSFAIEELAKRYLNELKHLTAHYERVHFVTHSMGGIMLRVYLATNNISNIGKVVMLGPPNKGSEVVDYLKDWEVFEWVNGPAGKQLGTDSLSLPKTLGAITVSTGIIAGDRSINWINSLMIPGDDDGKVSVDATKLDGMLDHIVLHTTHPLMMRNEKVIEQTLYFLKNGVFKREK